MGQEYFEGCEISMGQNIKIDCAICHLQDYTGFYFPNDLDSRYHKGFTIGKGKTMYWEIIWHKSGHCTVYNKETQAKRYIDGGSQITIHFK